MFKPVLAAVLTTSCTMIATSSSASDPLPLRQGIYVLDDVACDRLSHAVTLSYWGNELNAQRTIRSIVRVEKEADRFLLTLEVSDEGSEPETEQWVLRIEHSDGFVVIDPAPVAAYRWCFDRMP